MRGTSIWTISLPSKIMTMRGNVHLKWYVSSETQRRKAVLHSVARSSSVSHTCRSAEYISCPCCTASALSVLFVQQRYSYSTVSVVGHGFRGSIESPTPLAPVRLKVPAFIGRASDSCPLLQYLSLESFTRQNHGKHSSCSHSSKKD